MCKNNLPINSYYIAVMTRVASEGAQDKLSKW